MSRAARIALVIVLVVFVSGLLTTAYAAHRVVNAGSVTVRVHEYGPGGNEVFVWVPAIVIDVAAPFVSLAIPPEAREEMEPWLPMAAAIADDLTELPDAVFVSVESRDETVRIAKVGNQLVIDVESNDESVHVSVPIRSVASLLNHL